MNLMLVARSSRTFNINHRELIKSSVFPSISLLRNLRPKKHYRFPNRITHCEHDISTLAASFRPQIMDANTLAVEDGPPLSKNQLKKRRRDQLWEEGRDKRKAIRKEKREAKKLKKQAARGEITLQSSATTDSHQAKGVQERVQERRKRHQPQPIQLPITLVIDCGFDDLMRDTERKSLGAQITRAYSDNNHAPFKAHLIVSSFGGYLKERFDTLLSGHHRSWKGVRFLEEDFIEAASQAEMTMRSPEGGSLTGVLAAQPSTGGAEKGQSGEIVYLTADSPKTLEALSPYSTYIIGGIVDKNRHKGICYKKAMDHGVKTAKLPIGDYLQMSTRTVLTTNHVVEIMLRWLECGDWGEAFMKVIPQRKGGLLKSSDHADEEEGDGGMESSNEKEWVVDSDVEVVNENTATSANERPQAD